MARSPLKPPRMSPDAVVLEVFFVRFPVGDAEANGPLWEEVDEMHLAPEARGRLARNGFRTGLVGGQLPLALAMLLELNGKPAPGPGSLETQMADLEHEPRVVRRRLQLRPGVRTEIVASEIRDELPVLVCDACGVQGEIFTEAQAILAAKIFPERDGQVRLKLVPEVHYGESKLRHVIAQGAIRIQPGRAKRAFDDLAIEAVLAPGHALILGTLTDRPGSLGHRFFTQDTAGEEEQKLLVIRLAQTQHDGLFDPVGVLPLDVLTEEAVSPQRR